MAALATIHILMITQLTALNQITATECITFSNFCRIVITISCMLLITYVKYAVSTPKERRKRAGREDIQTFKAHLCGYPVNQANENGCTYKTVENSWNMLVR